MRFTRCSLRVQHGFIGLTSGLMVFRQPYRLNVSEAQTNEKQFLVIAAVTESKTNQRRS